MRRRLVATLWIFTTVVMAVGLVACSSESAEPGDQAAEATDPAAERADTLADPADEVAESADGLESADLGEALATSIGAVGITFDPDSLVCSDIDPVEGAVVECEFTLNGQPVGLLAKVLGIDGNKIEFDVSTEARPAPAEVLASAVANRASQQLGGMEVSATCDSDFAPTVDSTVNCTVTSDGEDLEIEVVVDAVEGGRIDWRMQSK
jgi:hypothetical protein